MAWFIEMGHLIYQAADRITYLYPHAIEEALGLGSVLEKSFVIPNGMHVEDFDQTHRRFCQLSAQRDAQRQPWRLAFAGRLVPIKGLLVLLEASATLRNGGLPFTLDIMGNADDQEYAMQCQRKCSELRLDDVVSFVGNQDLRQSFAEYDLLVLPSYNEGLPIVVLEAMAVGLPVVGTRVGGMAQIIEEPLTERGNDRCGILVEPGNPRALARALHEVLSDSRMYHRLQSQARSRVLSHFQLEQAMSAYRKVYRQLAEKAIMPSAWSTPNRPMTRFPRLQHDGLFLQPLDNF